MLSQNGEDESDADEDNGTADIFPFVAMNVCGTVSYLPRGFLVSSPEVVQTRY